MRALLAVAFFPSLAIADVQVTAPPDARRQVCLAAARQALRADFPWDWDGPSFEHESNHCLTGADRDGVVDLHCAGSCDSASCHTDLCDGWSSYVDVTMQTRAGADTPWLGPDPLGYDPDTSIPVRKWRWRRLVGGVLARVEVSTLREGADDARLRARVLRQALKARRALDACLSAR